MAGHGATAGRGPCISGYQYAVCVKCEKWWSWPRRCEDESTLYVPYSPTREMRFFAFPTRDNPTDTRPDPSGWLDRGVRGRGDGASRMIVPRPAAVNLHALSDGRNTSEAGRPRSECVASPEPAVLWIFFGWSFFFRYGWPAALVRGAGRGRRMIVPRPAAVNVYALSDGRLASEVGLPRSECLTSPEPADLWTELFPLRIPAGSFGARGGDAHNRAEACGSKLICLDRWSPRF